MLAVILLAALSPVIASPDFNEMNLHHRLVPPGGDYILGADNLGREDLKDMLNGPVAIAFGFGEITGITRVLAEYIRSAGTTVSLKGGFLPERTLTVQEVNTLATLPSREVLIAKAVGGIKSPLYGLVNCLVAPLRGLSSVLQARIEQLEGEG